MGSENIVTGSKNIFMGWQNIALGSQNIFMVSWSVSLGSQQSKDEGIVLRWGAKQPFRHKEL